MSVFFCGPICTDNFCGGLGPIFFLYFYGPFIISGIFILLALSSFLKTRDQRSLKFAGMCLLIAIVIWGGRSYLIYRNEHRYDSRSKATAKAIDFQVYDPAYLPHGSKARLISIGAPPTPNLTLMTRQGTPDIEQATGYPYVTLDYIKIILYQFNQVKISQFNGRDCGPDFPEGADLALYFRGDYIKDCKYVTTTPNGFKVFSQETVMKRYYATKDDTKISIESYLSQNEVLKVIENLKPVRATALKFVNKQN
jgi:hypothetical protein